MEKIFILVGMADRVVATEFMDVVGKALADRKISCHRYSYDAFSLYTPRTKITFVFDPARQCKESWQADAVYGVREFRTPLMQWAKPDADNPVKHIGLVNYICAIENKPWSAYEQMLILRGRQNGKSLTIADYLNYACEKEGAKNMNKVLNDLVQGKQAYISTESGRVPVKIDNLSMSQDEATQFEGHMLSEEAEYVRNDIYTTKAMATAMLTEIMDRRLQKAKNSRTLPEIKNVYFNKPVTVVIWADGTKTIVRCQNNDTYSEELGLAMAICKKVLGTNKSGSNYYDTFKKYINHTEEDTIEQLA